MIALTFALLVPLALSEVTPPPQSSTMLAFREFAFTLAPAFAPEDALTQGLLLVPLVLCAACCARVDLRSGGVLMRSIVRSALAPRLALGTAKDD